jgi:uncharacterized membrane-anchored protein
MYDGAENGSGGVTQNGTLFRRRLHAVTVVVTVVRAKIHAEGPEHEVVGDVIHRRVQKGTRSHQNADERDAHKGGVGKDGGKAQDLLLSHLRLAEEEKKRLLAALDDCVDSLVAFGISRDTLIAHISKGGKNNA